jgi:hypothetical protein
LDDDDFLIPIFFLSESLRAREFEITIVIEIMPFYNAVRIDLFCEDISFSCSAGVADCLFGNPSPRLHPTDTRSRNDNQAGDIQNIQACCSRKL